MLSMHRLPSNVWHPQGERSSDLLQAVLTFRVVPKPSSDDWEHLAKVKGLMQISPPEIPTP